MSYIYPSELCGGEVVFGAAPTGPREPLVDRVLFRGVARLAADRGSARLEVRHVGRFVIDHGERVVVDLDDGVEPGRVLIWLMGTVAALLLGQRGDFALHASTVLLGGTGVGLTGRSGAGKSTTALELERRGHALVSDDVSPIRFTRDVRLAGDEESAAGGVVVAPFGRSVHVWGQTAVALGLDLHDARPVASDRPKLVLPPRLHSPVALHALVELCPVPGAGDGVSARRVAETVAVDALLRNAYRRPMLFALWGAEMVAWAVRLSRSLPQWTIERPSSGWSVDEVVNAVHAIAEERASAMA